MGSGASKERSGGPDGSNPMSMTSKARVKEARKLAGRHTNESDEFLSACMLVFKNADADQNGVLSASEFWTVLTSDMLNLNLSEEEVKQIQHHADVDSDGNITYEEFIPVMKNLLQRVYQDKDEDWNDWCMFIDPATDSPLYMNKRTGLTQKNRPENFNEERVEIRNFEYITLSDGNEVTTIMDECGQRLYMDWDTQQWVAFPEEWYDAVVPQQAIDEENDPRVGEYMHITRGQLATYLFENTRNTRLYFDEELGTWARMPLRWEVDVEEVRLALEELDRAYPSWNNANEQLLVLRECNYDVKEAIAFAEINFNLGANGEKEKGSGPSLGEAKKIRKLELAMAEMQQTIDTLRAQQEGVQSEAVQQLSRQKTIVETKAQRKERAAAEAQERAGDLAQQNAALRQRNAELESQLVAYQADSDQLKVLEEELNLLREGGAGGDEGKSGKGSVKLSKKITQQLDALRIENTGLKLKVTSLKTKMSKSSLDGDVAADLYKLVTYVKREKEEMAAEYAEQAQQLSDMFRQAITSSTQLKTQFDDRVRDLTAKYLKEQTQRKLLYNKVQELRGNIRVFCRVRNDDRAASVFKFPSDTELVIQKLQGGEELLDFERCYGPDSKQETVFEDTKPLILSCLDGYNVCIIAYGQTGSGKTFTMMGPQENPGVNRRAIKELLALCNSREEVDYEITVSLLEVYNEKLIDLLTKDRGKDLKILQGPNGSFVDGATERVVKTQEEVEAVMAQGDKNRSTGATMMNTDSSRSHLLLQLYVTAYNKISKAKTRGKLTLVDLAGSERISKSHASGERLTEAAAINKSLTALGQVFTSLATNSPHVPYRNSKLTYVLQDSLGGDSKTAVFVNVSPLESNLSETHMTLRFGQNIRKIELGPASKNTGGPPRPPKMSKASRVSHA